MSARPVSILTIFETTKDLILKSYVDRYFWHTSESLEYTSQVISLLYCNIIAHHLYLYRVFRCLPGGWTWILPWEVNYTQRHQARKSSYRLWWLFTYHRLWYRQGLEARECPRHIRHTGIHGSRGDVQTKPHDCCRLLCRGCHGLRMHVRWEALQGQIKEGNSWSHFV